MKNKQNNNNEDLNFEAELFYALKYHGYLFPQNPEEVERFEEVYGKTEVSIPPSIDINSNKLTDANLDFLDFQAAAFTSNDNTSFELPDDKLSGDDSESNSPITK